MGQRADRSEGPRVVDRLLEQAGAHSPDSRRNKGPRSTQAYRESLDAASVDAANSSTAALICSMPASSGEHSSHTRGHRGHDDGVRTERAGHQLVDPLGRRPGTVCVAQVDAHVDGLGEQDNRLVGVSVVDLVRRGQQDAAGLLQRPTPGGYLTLQLQGPGPGLRRPIEGERLGEQRTRLVRLPREPGRLTGVQEPKRTRVVGGSQPSGPLVRRRRHRSRPPGQPHASRPAPSLPRWVHRGQGPRWPDAKRDDRRRAQAARPRRLHAAYVSRRAMPSRRWRTEPAGGRTRRGPYRRVPVPPPPRRPTR